MAGIPVEQVPCAGTVPATLPSLEYPYIEASPGAGELVTPDASYPAGPQAYTDHEGIQLVSEVPSPYPDWPNTSTWLTHMLSQVVLVSPDVALGPPGP